MPALVWNSTCRLSTVSSGSLPSPPSAGSTSVADLFFIAIPPSLSQLRVECVSYGVADHDEAQHRDAQEDRREDQRLRRHEEPVARVGDHQTPRDVGRLDADTE